MEKWTRVAAVSDLKPDEGFGVEFRGKAVGLYLVEGEVRAVGDICPHQGDIRLSDGWFEDGVIECPMHQATFDVRNGKCLGGPATEDIAVFRIRVQDGDIFLACDD